MGSELGHLKGLKSGLKRLRLLISAEVTVAMAAVTAFMKEGMLLKTTWQGAVAG